MSSAINVANGIEALLALFVHYYGVVGVSKFALAGLVGAHSHFVFNGIAKAGQRKLYTQEGFVVTIAAFEHAYAVGLNFAGTFRTVRALSAIIPAAILSLGDFETVVVYALEEATSFSKLLLFGELSVVVMNEYIFASALETFRTFDRALRNLSVSI